MSQKRSVVAVILVVLLILIATAAVGYAGLSQSPGRIELSATEFDFGAIPNAGPVSHVFQVHNTGAGSLAITGVSTSCGCTTAEIGNRELASGETSDLVVTYNPLAHDGATGEFMRVVYVRSDDPDTPEASLTIRVTVVEP